MRSLTRSAIVGMAAVLALGAQARAGDWLDVHAKRVRITSGGATVKEGQSLRFECSWTLDFADDHSFWRAESAQRFPIRLDVDGEVLLSDEVVIAKGTELARPDGGFSSGIQGTSQVATWQAKGVGQHRLFCTVNDPKTISDQYRANNQTFIVVTVLPEREVQSGGPWPDPAPGGDVSGDSSARKKGLGKAAGSGAKRSHTNLPTSKKAPSRSRSKAQSPAPEEPSQRTRQVPNTQP